MQTLRDRTAIVSGMDGIVGSAIVSDFLAGGMNVVSMRPFPENAETASLWFNEYGQRFLTVSNGNREKDVVEMIANMFGGIDVVVVGQGLPPANHIIEEIDVSYPESVKNSHLTDGLSLLQKSLPYLKRSSAPRVIYLTSCESQTSGINDGIACTAAKDGLASLTASTAKQLARYGITVNTVAVGSIYNKTNPGSDEPKTNHIFTHEDTDILTKIPLGRLARPEDVSGAVCYLASEEAGYVTATVINVSGGYSG